METFRTAPGVTTRDLVDSVASELRTYLTTGQREQGFDCSANFRPDTHKRRHIAVAWPGPMSARSSTNSKSLRRSASTQSVSSVSTDGGGNSQVRHERDIRRRLEDQVLGGKKSSSSHSELAASTPRSRSAMSASSRSKSAMSSTPGRSASRSAGIPSSLSQRKRSETTPPHQLTGGEARRLMTLASKLIVASETVAMVPTPQRSTKLRRSTVPTSVDQLRKGTDTLERQLKHQRQVANSDYLASDASSMLLDDLEASGSEISLAESVSSVQRTKSKSSVASATPRAMKHSRPHTVRSSGRTQPAVNISPPSSTASLRNRHASTSTTSLKQQSSQRSVSQSHLSANTSSMVTRSDTTLVFSKNRSARKGDAHVHPTLRDSPYRTRTDLSASYNASSMSLVRKSSRQLAHAEDSRLMVDRATQTVEDKSTQTGEADSSTSGLGDQSDLSSTRRHYVSHPENGAPSTAEAYVQASSTSHSPPGSTSNLLGKSPETERRDSSPKRSPRKSHSMLVKEAVTMLEKLQALVQFEVEVHTATFVPLFAKDNQLLITLCGTERDAEQQPLETEDDEAPELLSNSKHTFHLHCEDIGNVKSIKFLHTSGDGWLPERIVIRRIPDDQVSFTFNFGSQGSNAGNATAQLAQTEVLALPQHTSPVSSHVPQLPGQMYTPAMPHPGHAQMHPQPYVYQHQPYPSHPYAGPPGPGAGQYAPQAGQYIPPVGQYVPQAGQLVMTPSGPMAWLPHSPDQQDQTQPSSAGGSQQQHHAHRQAPGGLDELVKSRTTPETTETEATSDSEDKERIDAFLNGFRVGVDASRKLSNGSVEDDVLIEHARKLANPDGCSVHEAAASADISRLRDLLDKSAHWLSTADESGMLPIHCAAANGQLDSLKMLCNYDVDLEASTSTGYTALHCAAMHGHVRCMKLLGALGSSVNSRSIDRQTPLHVAAANGHLECAKWLVANRAKLKMKDSQGRKPKKLARDNGHSVIADFLESCQDEVSRSGSALNTLRTPKDGAVQIGSGQKRPKKQSVSYWQSDDEVQGDVMNSEQTTPEDIKQRRSSQQHTPLDSHTAEELQQHYNSHHDKMAATNQSFLDVVRQEVDENT